MKKVDIKTEDLIKDEKMLVRMFNKHYINIAEETIQIRQLVLITYLLR